MQDERQEEEEREVAEVEMLLGAYYMTLDSTWDKLIDISEFVEDAEVGHTRDIHCTHLELPANEECVDESVATAKANQKIICWTDVPFHPLYFCNAGTHGSGNGHISQQYDKSELLFGPEISHPEGLQAS